MKRIASLALSVEVILSAASAQTVIENTNLEFSFLGEGDPVFGNHVGQILQTEDSNIHLGGDPTGGHFYYDGSNLTATSQALDEGSEWYLVSEGDSFGFTSLASEQFVSIISDTNHQRPTISVGTGDFYLGVTTTGQGLREPCEPRGFFCRNVFGWIHLAPSPNGLRLEATASAVAYDSLGIIVGTAQVVPEPATLLLALCLLPAYSTRRSRA